MSLVVETGEALARIVAQVSAMDGVVGEIAASTGEQASALGEVSNAVNHMDQATQANAAMVEETNAAAHTLSAEGEALIRSVARFRLAGAGGAAPAAVPMPLRRIA